MKKMVMLCLCSMCIPTVIFAEIVSVKKVEEMFSCSNAYKKATILLEQMCEEKHKRLVDIKYLDCWPTGDDGSYVSYVAVNAEGECI